MRVRAVTKEAVYAAAHAVGVTSLGRASQRNALTVLTYHSFGPAAEYPYLHRQPVARMAAQLRHLMRYYEIVGLEEGLARVEAGEEATRPMVAITVDDGYGDNYDHLFPLLRDAGVPATIFVATDYLDSGRLPWPTRIDALLHHATVGTLDGRGALEIATPAQRRCVGRKLRHQFKMMSAAEREAALEDLALRLAPRPYTPIPPLAWWQVRAMQDAGLSIGSHTRFHGWLDCLAEQEVADELTYSRDRISAETDRDCRLLAYPNGNWSADVAEAAAAAGYTFALSQDRGANRRAGLRALALHRVEVPFNELLGTFACRVGGVAL